MGEHIPQLTILYSSDEYDQEKLLTEERRHIMLVNAHKNEEYFNKTIPQQSNFTYSGFSTFYDTENDYYQRVSLTDNRIVTERFIGTTKGKKSSEETKIKIKQGMLNFKDSSDYPAYVKKQRETSIAKFRQP